MKFSAHDTFLKSHSSDAQSRNAGKPNNLKIFWSNNNINNISNASVLITHS